MQVLSRRTFVLGFALASASLPGAGSAMAQLRPRPSSVTTIDVPGVGPMQVLTYQARFVSADPVERRVVLEGSNGRRWSVRVPPLLGDVMDLANSRSLTIRMLPGAITYLGKARQGTPGKVMAEVVLKEGLPGWPQDFGLREVTIVATLVDIDKAAGMVSFEGADGLVRTVRATDPQVLANVQQVELGDLSEIRYYEGIAISANR